MTTSQAKDKKNRATKKTKTVNWSIVHLSKEEAINNVLESEKEPALYGDLRKLVRKYKNSEKGHRRPWCV
ncbi:MAG: hypothetical protein AAB808_01565 [Patescibacteria group bacterium]